LRKLVSKETIKYSNLPESYIKRATEQIEWKNPEHGPQYVKGKVRERPWNRFYMGEHRPWTKEFQNENQPGTWKDRVLVEPLKDWFFFKGDVVEIMTGKDKGKQGLVNYVVRERNWVYVEGLNTKYETHQIGGKLMYKREKPLLVTGDVKLVDAKDNQPTEVEWRYTEGGERVRVSVRTGRLLPIPILDEETPQYKTKDTYIEQPKDTVSEDVMENTFKPSLATFDMAIMQSCGIQETRVPKKSYWYFVEERA